MINFKGTDFNKIYYDMLNFAYYYESDYYESRVGEVKDLGPATFEISEDQFRLVQLNKRAINPFFALTEFSWIFEGSNKLEPLEYYIKNYNNYSDDGKTLNGAYGYRLRNYFKRDQIEDAIKQLKEKPSTRRVVLTMWSIDDLFSKSNDLPCNISILLKIREGKLDITVLNRSNDIFLGVPYNVFIFHLLQLYIAQRVGCCVGVQRHFTDSLHLYKKHVVKVKEILDSNDYKTIKYTKLLNSSFDPLQYINVDHEAIINRDIKLINNRDIKDLFNVYIRYKNGEEIHNMVHILPKNILGYISYQWFKEFSKVDLQENEFSCIEKDIRFKTISTVNFDQIKYKSNEEIVSNINNFVALSIHRYNEFSKVVVQENSLFILNDNNETKKKFLRSVGLSLVVANIYSIYAPDIKRTTMEKMKLISIELKINFNDVLSMTTYESQFLDIINS